MRYSPAMRWYVVLVVVAIAGCTPTWERHQTQLAEAEAHGDYAKAVGEQRWLIDNAFTIGPREQHSYFTYFVRVPGGRRDRLAKYLYDKGIYTTLRYHPLHMNAIYKSTARLPHCEQLNEEGLNLPLHPNLSDADVDQILSAIRSFGG